MKKVGRFIANILIVVYAIIAITVTILLLSYNDYQKSVIGDYTFIIMEDDELEEAGYPEGALVLVKETKAKNINEGDHIFLYRNISTSQFEIKYAQVIMKDTSGGEHATQYVLDGNAIVDHEDVIGTTKHIKVIPHLGTILSILQSRYGYLFLIVVVSFIAFLYEIYELIMEIKYGEREEDEEYEDDDEEEYEEYDEDEEEEEVVRPRKTATKKKTETANPRKTTTARKTSSTSKTAGTGSKATTTRKNKTTTRTTTAKKTSATGKATTSKTTTSAKKTTSKGTATRGTTAKTGTAKKTTKSK